MTLLSLWRGNVVVVLAVYIKNKFGAIDIFRMSCLELEP